MKQLYTIIQKVIIHNFKQLLDEVLVISRIIKVEVGVISWSWRLRLIALTEILIILDITKTESNNCLIIHWTKQKKTCFCFFTDGKQHKARKLDMITLRSSNVVIHDTITCDLECPWHDYCIICSYDVTGTDFENSLYAFGQSEKRWWVQCIIIIIFISDNQLENAKTFKSTLPNFT